MKKTYISFAIISMLFSCQENKFSIIGAWSGNDNDHIIKFSFYNNSNCLITFNNDQVLMGKYNVNFDKKPIPLSITEIKGLNHPLHTIIRFINKDNIQISKFSKRWKFRPLSFDTKKSYIIERVE